MPAAVRLMEGSLPARGKSRGSRREEKRDIPRSSKPLESSRFGRLLKKGQMQGGAHRAE
jgi:hypothetical protein